MAVPDAFLTLVLLLLRLATSQSPTSIVTATTAETVTEPGACDDFVGACVVYGTGHVPPHTTTVYVASNPPADHTVSTTTVTTSRTSDATPDVGSACADFTGACVVYGGAENPSYTTTTSNGESNSEGTPQGNGDGYIAAEKGDNDGYIGDAVSVSMGVVVPLITFVLVNIGFVVWL